MACSCFSMCFPTPDRVTPAEVDKSPVSIGEAPNASNSMVVAPTPQSVRPKEPVEVPKWVEGMRNSKEDADDVCRYYCPLCMLYFENVYETNCCGHTICDSCAADLLDTAAMGVSEAAPAAGFGVPHTVPEDDLLPEMSIPLTPRCTQTKPLPVPCPFCRQEDGLELKITVGGEGYHLRNYEDSPAGPKSKDSPAAVGTTSTPNGSSFRTMRPSPLKVGDSFEKMMSKMVPLEPFNVANASQGKPLSRPGSRQSRPSSREALGRPNSREGLPPRPPRVPTPVQMATTPVPLLSAAPRSSGSPLEEVPEEQGLAGDPENLEGESVKSDVLGDEPHSNPSITEKLNVASEIQYAETTPRREGAPEVITTQESTIIGTPMGIQPVPPQPGMVAG